MGDHNRNPNAIAKRNGHGRQPQLPPGVNRVLATELASAIVPKKNVLVMPAERIRQAPQPVEGSSDMIESVTEIFAKRKHRNEETGEMTEDEEPGWHVLNPPLVAFPAEEQLPHELCDIVVYPVSVVMEPATLVGVPPRTSRINVAQVEIYRVDAVSILNMHERQLHPENFKELATPTGETGV